MSEVQAVKSRAMVERIEHLLADRGQIYADVWRIGLNLALRISDLLALTYDDVSGEHLTLVESKTGKRHKIKINTAARSVIDRRRTEHPDHKYLFQSDSNRSRAMGKPISREVVARTFKQVGEGKSVGIRLGTHSMRKTLGWLMHSNGQAIERTAKRLNHGSPAVTMRYIGLDQEDLDASCDEFCI